MGLEKLEVENFKSYTGCHTIGPFDKFTCVVGPNGSGKSNIMDAIAFALGFSSSSLRTSSVVNLINNGCSQASVKLFIDQHTFKRHITTSGKSTYFADGKLVSFDEYSKIVESLGLCLKLRNFMVFQGDIHDLANKTPKELCEYFEVLSGSIEHKKEYDEVANKLNKELAECAILFEQKKSVLSVMKEEKEEEKQLEIFNECLKEKGELEQQILNKELVELKAKLSTAEMNLNSVEAEGEKINKEVRHFESAVMKKKEEVEKIRNEYSSLEQDLQNLRYKKMSQVREMAAIYKSKDKNNIRKKEVSELINENLKKVGDLKESLKKEEGDLERLEEAYEKFLRMREENLNKFKFTKEQEDLFLRNTLNLQEEIEKNKLALREIKKKQTLEIKRKKEEEVKKDKIRSLQTNVDVLRRNIGDLYSKMGEDLRNYEELEKKEGEINRRIYETVSDLLKIRASKKISLKKENTRSVVNTLKGIFPGVHGLLIDLVKPIEKNYYGPILTILQSYDYSVVVDSDSTALTCINYIKEKKLCKLTFLPLQTLLKKKKEVILYNEKDFRSALVCVSYDEQFSKAIHHVLKDTIIADTKEKAMELVYSKGMKNNVCSLDNFYIRSQGRIINSNSLQVSEDDEKFSQLVEERKSLLRELKAVQDKKSRMSKIEIVKERIKVYEDKISEDQKRIESLKDQDKQKEEFIEEKEEEVLKKIQDLQGELKKEEVKIFGPIFGSSSYEEFTESLGENKTAEFKNLKNKIQNKIQSIKEDLKDLESQNQELSQSLKTCHEITNSQSLDPEIESEIRRVDFLVEKKKKTLDSLLEGLKKINEEYKGVCMKKKDLNMNYLNVEALRTRLEEEIESKKRFAMLEEIEIKEDLKSEEAHVLKERLALVNKKINEMVPTIKTGKKDLNYNKILKDYEEAKNKAMDTRRSLNEIKRQRLSTFMGCFEVVSSEIGKIYQEISNNEMSRGNAYLVLDNPTEPYLEGVRFHIMPPTKRFREIGLLSGGEKSMAILALMFAINKFKPVPFFVLDEFDSALDKTNVSRMVDFFVRSEVQFLVISLKPILFQFSDSLVGVYKESGSSKLLTYRL